MQGAFVKRHQYKKADGSQLKFTDISVGTNLELYGKTIHITDADAATRSFMEQQSLPQSSAEPYPAGPYDEVAASRIHTTGNADDLRSFVWYCAGRAINRDHGSSPLTLLLLCWTL